MSARSYDDQGEGYAGEPGRSNTGKILLIIGLIGCGGLLVRVLACGGGGYWFYTKMQAESPAVTAAAEAFLDALKANHIKEAYDQTASQYKQRTTLEQFTSLLKAYPALTDYTSRTITANFAFSGTDQGAATVMIQLQTKKEDRVCSLTLMKEQGVWKVAQVQVN